MGFLQPNEQRTDPHTDVLDGVWESQIFNGIMECPHTYLCTFVQSTSSAI